jgi:hypothetical protein
MAIADTLGHHHTGKPINPTDYAGAGPEFQALREGRNLYYPSRKMHEDAAEAAAASAQKWSKSP